MADRERAASMRRSPRRCRRPRSAPRGSARSAARRRGPRGSSRDRVRRIFLGRRDDAVADLPRKALGHEADAVRRVGDEGDLVGLGADQGRGGAGGRPRRASPTWASGRRPAPPGRRPTRRGGRAPGGAGGRRRRGRSRPIARRRGTRPGGSRPSPCRDLEARTQRRIDLSYGPPSRNARISASTWSSEWAGRRDHAEPRRALGHRRRAGSPGRGSRGREPGGEVERGRSGRPSMTGTIGPDDGGDGVSRLRDPRAEPLPERSRPLPPPRLRHRDPQRLARGGGRGRPARRSRRSAGGRD